MNTNGFRENELISRRIKVGNEWQTKTFPIIAGRLRLAHEENQTLSIQTEILKLESDFVVVKATVNTEKGTFTGTGTASAQRDRRLADALVELAETRGIARALRWASYGVEMTSAEEVSHLQDEPTQEPKEPSNGNGKGVSTAQLKLLYALSKQAELSEEDREQILSPLQAKTFNDLSCSDASRLITCLKTQVTAS